MSFIISITALYFSYFALGENRRILKWSNNYHRLVEVEKMFLKHPRLLAFHGITDGMLKKCDVSIGEVVYLLQSFRAGQESWEIDPIGESVLTPYRKHMLKQPKVAKIWREVLHKRLLFRSGFIKMVDEYLRSQEKKR